MRQVPSFTSMRDAVADLAAEKRLRLEGLEATLAGVSGVGRPDLAFSGVREQLRLVDGAVRLLTLLAPIEGEVRRLRKLGRAAREDPLVPSLWRD